MNQSVQQQLWDVVEPIVSGHGYDLIDIEYVQQKGWVLRIYIDLHDIEVVPGLGVAPGDSVSLDNCAQISREVSAVLDVEDIIPHAYNLEVSSPGIQRPLRKKTEFERFISCPVKVRTFGPIKAENNEGGKPSRKFAGILSGVKEDSVEVKVDGLDYRIPLEQIARAHLDPDMDQWMALAVKRHKKKES